MPCWFGGSVPDDVMFFSNIGLLREFGAWEECVCFLSHLLVPRLRNYKDRETHLMSYYLHWTPIFRHTYDFSPLKLWQLVTLLLIVTLSNRWNTTIRPLRIWITQQGKEIYRLLMELRNALSCCISENFHIYQIFIMLISFIYNPTIISWCTFCGIKC